MDELERYLPDDKSSLEDFISFGEMILGEQDMKNYMKNELFSDEHFYLLDCKVPFIKIKNARKIL